MKKIITVLMIALVAMTCVFASQNDWYATETKDEFGDPTGDVIVVGIGEGTFSNSYYSNKSLEFGMRFELNSDGTICPMLKLYKYGNITVYSTSDTYYQLSVKLDDGKVHNSYLFQFGGDGWIYFLDDIIVDYLMDNNKVKCVITEYYQSSSKTSEYTYNFVLESRNFKEVMQESFPELFPEETVVEVPSGPATSLSEMREVTWEELMNSGSKKSN